MIKCALQFQRKSNQHCPNQYFAIIIHKSNQIKCWFLMRGENRSTRGKPLIAEQRTNKLNPHMTPSAEIKHGPHWWKASALTTRPTLPPNPSLWNLRYVNFNYYYYFHTKFSFSVLLHTTNSGLSSTKPFRVNLLSLCHLLKWILTNGSMSYL